MSYPALTIEAAQRLADRLRPEVESMLSGGDPLATCDDESQWVIQKPGADYPRALVARCALDLASQTISDLRRLGPPSLIAACRLEAKMASEIHQVLSACHMDHLEDEDFWRYLALFPFRWYLIAREPELQPQDFGGFTEMGDEDTGRRRRVKSLVTQLIYRTFLWGKIAFEHNARDRYQRATVIADREGPSIDIWHSHLIRTQLGQLGVMPHAFLDCIAELSDTERMKGAARETEKLLARMKHIVFFDAHNKQEADSIVAEQLSNIA